MGVLGALPLDSLVGVFEDTRGDVAGVDLVLSWAIVLGKDESELVSSSSDEKSAGG